jgi:AcrR family transcriptional regulator
LKARDEAAPAAKAAAGRVGRPRVGRPRVDSRQLTRPPEEEVLYCAARLFARQGFARASTREIAKAAGLRQSSLFHYYRTKEDILVALTNKAHIKPLATLEALQNAGHRPGVALYLLMEAHVLHICENHIELKVILESTTYISVTRFRRYITQEKKYTDGIRRLIESGIESGEFIDVCPDLATAQVLGMCNWIIKWYRKGGKRSPSEIARHMARAAVRGLVADLDQIAKDLPGELIN